MHFFTHDAWLVIEDMMKRKKENVWVCKSCQHDLGEESIAYESCLHYHFHCVRLIKKPKVKNWFC